MFWTIALIAAVLIVLFLGFYAGRLLFLLKQQKSRHDAARRQRIERIAESIQVIALAMEQQQCNLSEGAIRICNLLYALPLSSPPDYREKFPRIFTLFVSISGFATLETRNNLPKEERRKQDEAREQVESEWEVPVLKELPAIKKYCSQIVVAS